MIGGHLDTQEGKLNASVVYSGLFADSFARKRIIGRLVNIFITAARINEHSSFAHPLLRFRFALPREHQALLEQIKKVSFRLVIDKAPVRQLERRGMRLVEEIFKSLRDNPKQLVPSWDEDYAGASTVDRRVCDYVAGMTDGYADKVYRRLFVPGYGSSSDEL